MTLNSETSRAKNPECSVAVGGAGRPDFRKVLLEPVLRPLVALGKGENLLEDVMAIFHLSGPSSDTIFPTFVISVGDPNPHVFGPPGSINQRYGSSSGFLPVHFDTKF